MAGTQEETAAGCGALRARVSGIALPPLGAYEDVREALECIGAGEPHADVRAAQVQAYAAQCDPDAHELFISVLGRTLSEAVEIERFEALLVSLAMDRPSDYLGPLLCLLAQRVGPDAHAICWLAELAFALAARLSAGTLARLVRTVSLWLYAHGRSERLSEARDLLHQAAVHASGGRAVIATWRDAMEAALVGKLDEALLVEAGGWVGYDAQLVGLYRAACPGLVESILARLASDLQARMEAALLHELLAPLYDLSRSEADVRGALARLAVHERQQACWLNEQLAVQLVCGVPRVLRARWTVVQQAASEAGHARG